MKHFLLFLFLSWPCLLAAQFLPSLAYDKGILTAAEGKQYEGDLHFDECKGELLFRTEKNIQSFSLKEIERFEFFDERLNRKRYFVNYTLKAGNKALFEYYQPFGEIQFLRKCDSAKKRPLLGLNCFYLLQQTTLTRITRFKKQFAPLFAANGIDLALLAKEKNYRTYLWEDQVKLIACLNKIKDKEKSNRELTQ